MKNITLRDARRVSDFLVKVEIAHKLCPFSCRCDGGGKHEFHDPKYNKEREEVTERVHDAIEAAFSKPGTSSSQNKQTAATASSASATGMVANPVLKILFTFCLRVCH